MKKRVIWWLAALLAGLALTAAGAAPVAAIDSEKPFSVNGRVLPTAGVGGWPVFAGDRIETGDSAALLRFKDGSFVRLDKKSQIALMERSGKVGVKLVQGEAALRLSPSPSVVIDGMAQAAASSGLLKVEDGQLKFTALGNLALLGPRSSSSANAIIGIVYGPTPPRTELVPGPEPVSSYRGTP